MKKRLTGGTIRRAFRTATWASLLGERRGKAKAWACTFCGVIGSHRRGCHYVTEVHRTGRKTVRRGMLGIRTRLGRQSRAGSA